MRVTLNARLARLEAQLRPPPLPDDETLAARIRNQLAYWPDHPATRRILAILENCRRRRDA